MKRLGKAAVAAILAFASAPVTAQDVGVMSAVNRDVQGARPTEAARALFLNDRLILDERVTTSDVGGGQVMFLDQTTLTLSPNSDIILDRYVYDPDTQTGGATISMLKGAMRFVGGRITKSGVATIRTPTATIGIRGGIGHITVDEDGSTRYIHIAGQSATAENEAGALTVTREGGTIFIPASLVDGQSGLFGDDVDGLDGGSQADAGSQQGSETGGDQQTGAGQQTNGGFGVAGQTPQSGDQGDESEEERLLRQREELRERIEQLLERRRIGAPDAVAPLIAGFGGVPTFSGIATPEEVRVAVRTEGGVGDGGETDPVTPARVTDGVRRIEIRVSGADGAVSRPPVSTSGEQSETSFNAPPPDLGIPPLNEIADDNIANNIVDEIDQIQDGLEFQGSWSAIAGLRDGGFVTRNDDLKFNLRYSLASDSGVVVVELPDAGDLAETNLTTLSGDAIKGDRFLVVGDAGLTLTGDSGLATQLGGNATNTDITISASDVANGLISIDYLNSALPNIQFVDGEISPTQGARVLSDSIDASVVQFRNEQ